MSVLSRALFLLAFASCAATGPAAAQAEAPPLPGADPWRPETTTHLAGSHGLTGFGSMVDGRIPTPFFARPLEGPLGATSTRVSLRYAATLRSRRIWTDGADGAYREARHALIAHYGLTVQGIDLTLGVPVEHVTEQVLVDDAPDPDLRTCEGVGDLTGGLKVAFRIPNFFMQDWAIAALAPYVLGGVPTGADAVGGEAWVEAGVALSGPFGYGVRYVGNAAVLQREGGTTAFVYRFGVSAVPVARDGLALRAYLHVDGVEVEGKPNSTVALALGLQALLGDMLTLELGASVELQEAGRVEPDLRRAAARDLGGAVTRVRGEGGLELTFGIGVVL